MSLLAVGRWRAPARRLLLLGGSRAAAAALGFGGAALLARALSPADLGTWALALAAQGYALHVSELGLRSVATAAAARDPGGLPGLLRRYLALRSALAVLVVGIVAAGSVALAPAAAPVVVAAVASVLAVTLQVDWVALSDDRQALAGALLLVRPAAFLVPLAAMTLAGTPPGLGAAAGLYLAAWGLAAAASWLALAGRGHPDRSRAAPSLPASTTGALLRAGLPLCAVTLLNQALLSADLVLAGAVLGTAAAGSYFLAAQVATAGLVLANAAGQAALARLAGHAPDGPGFAAALAVEARALLLCGGTLALGLLLLGPPLLPLLFGAVHGEAGGVLLALLPWFLLQHPTTLLQGALAATGDGRRVLRANLAMLAALVPALALAAASGSLVAFALARGAAEAVRLASLVLALPPPARRSVFGWPPAPAATAPAVPDPARAAA